ncbi:MAG: hypothetical protein AAF216_06075 [Pseudomonadota bacterium]
MSSSHGANRLNNYATIVAVVLSTVAIAVSLLEVAAMRDHQKASVWPYLSVQQSYFQSRFSLTIENKGVGPAKLESIDWRIDGEPITDLDQLILDTVGEDLAFSYDTYRTSDPANDVLASGEEVTIFSVPIRDDTMAFLRGVNNRITLNACYCSIYDECWSVALSEGGAEDVERCT